MREDKGFSILDLLTTLGVAGLLALAAAPLLSGLASQFRLLEAATEMGFEVARARSQAVAKSERVRFHLDVERFWVERFNDDSEEPGWEQVGGDRSLPHGVVGSGDGTIEFNPSGLATDDVELVVESATGSKAIHVSILGKVEVR